MTCALCFAVALNTAECWFGTVAKSGLTPISAGQYLRQCCRVVVVCFLAEYEVNIYMNESLLTKTEQRLRP